jgi:Protein of unknown function (DUF3667)
MASNCQNCQQVITENFCGNCGQKKYKRIDRKYIWDEVQYSLLHTNKGFLYSVKNILKNPGKAARDFIDGNRVNHYKPILLAFVLSGISAFISFKVIGMNNIMRQIYAKEKYSGLMNDMFSYVASYSSFIMLLLIPLFAIFTFLVFRKWGQNYYEHVVMNAFGLSFYTLTNIIIFYPIMYLLRDRIEVFAWLTMVSMAFIPFILAWFYRGFYSEKKLGSIILKVLLILFLIMVAYFLLIMVLVIAYLVFMGPGAIKQFQPK